MANLSAAYVFTYAGAGAGGFAGDGGQATLASLYFPTGAVVSTTGSVFVVDQNNARIRLVAPNGVISTFAGSGSGLGDGGQASSAQFSYPYDAALDSGGSLYVSDSSNYRIRKILPSGVISTIAGNGGAGFSGDTPQQATAASIVNPNGLAVDASGNLYFAENPGGGFSGHRVRKVSAGVLSSYAGSGNAGNFGGDGGPATSAFLSSPTGLALDSAGVMYVADSGNHVIRRITAAGVISTVAGTPKTSGFAGDGGPATSALLNNPYAVACFGSAGVIYVVDYQNNRIRLVSGGVISTVVGGPMGHTGDGGPASSALLNVPVRVVLDPQSSNSVTPTLFIADAGNNLLRIAVPLGYYYGGGGTQRCPAGTWGAGISPACSGACGAGYYCPSGSTAPTGAGLCAAGSYCPAGSAVSTGAGPCAAGSWCPAGSVSSAGQPLGGACSPGYYCPAGTPSATAFPCPASTYGSSSGLVNAACSGTCAPGYYCPIGTVFPIPCAPGTFVNVPGSTSAANCIGCVAGTYNAFSGQSALGCTSCAAGTASAAVGSSTAATCTVCGAGYYSASPGAAACSACPAGTYSTGAASSGNTGCVSCPSGFYQPVTAATTSAACVPCAAGLYGATAGLTTAACSGVCGPGYVCPLNSTSPLPCPSGSYNNLPSMISMQNCTGCVAGTFNAFAGQTQVGCVVCAAGTASAAVGSSSAATCTNCGAGYYSASPGAAACSACPAGTYSTSAAPAGNTGCISCPSGFYQPVTAATTAAACVPCAAGLYGATAGLTTAACSGVCGPGYVCPLNSTSPLPCPSGSYNNLPSMISMQNCTGCVAGTFNAFAGQTQVGCVVCAAGTASAAVGSSSAATCTNCGAGYYSVSPGAAACSACPAGSYSTGAAPAGNTACVSCPSGFYQPGTAATTAAACVPCPAGVYGSSPGATTAACSGLCSPGYVCPLNSTAPTPCPPGTYGNLPGMASLHDCTGCIAGTYNPSSGQAFAGCVPCAAGTASSVVGSTTSATCVSCPAGTSTYSSGASSLASCVTLPFACPSGTQPSTATPLSVSDCVPLVCDHALAVSPGAGAGTSCYGCPPGFSGSAGACQPCAAAATAGLVCPGLTSAPLHTPAAWPALLVTAASTAAAGAGASVGQQATCATMASLFSGVGGGGGGTTTAAAAAAGTAGQGGSSSTSSSAGGSSAAAALSNDTLVLSEVIVGATAAGVALLALALWFCASRLARRRGRRSNAKGGSDAAAAAAGGGGGALTACPLRLLAACRSLDAFSLRHAVPDRAHPRNEATPLGGACSVIGVCALAAVWVVLVLQRAANNVLTQVAVQGLSSAVLASAAAVPVAGAGVQLVVAAEGEAGDCAVLSWSNASLAAGAFTLLSTSACGPLAAHTLSCPGCLVTAGSALTLSLPWSCQSMGLWLTTTTASGVTSTAYTAATVASGSGTLLSSVSWTVPLMLAVQTDATGGSALPSVRGYSALQDSLVVGTRALQQGAAAATVTLQPATARVSVTVALSPPQVYQAVSLSERTSVLQLLASLAGVTGVFALFGVAFQMAERAGATRPPPAGPMPSLAGRPHLGLGSTFSGISPLFHSSATAAARAPPSAAAGELMPPAGSAAAIAVKRTGFSRAPIPDNS